MKRLLYSIILILCALSTHAYDFENNGLYYTIIEDGGVEVVRNGNNFYQQTTITIPKTVKNNGTSYNVVSIANGTFYKCPNLTSITISDNIKYLKGWVVNDCPKLKTIVFNAKNAEHDNNGASFYDLPELTTISIGNNCTYIPQGFIAGTKFTKLTSITIGNKVKTIGAQAFQDCINLETVTLGSGLTTISHHAFYGCTSLKTITFPSTLTTIETHAFANCIGLTKLTISLNIKTLGMAFYGCNNIKSVEWNAKDCKVEYGAICADNVSSISFGTQVKVIPAYLLQSNSKVQTVNIPSSVQEIGRMAFMGCTGIKSVKFENSQIKIKAFAFNGCSAIETLELPTDLQQIDTLAFGSCDGLQKVIYMQSNPIEIGYSEYGIYFNPFAPNWGHSLADVELVVPEDAVPVFKEMNGWKEFMLPDFPTEIESIISPISKSSSHIELQNGVFYIKCEGQTFTIDGRIVK